MEQKIELDDGEKLARLIANAERNLANGIDDDISDESEIRVEKDTLLDGQHYRYQANPIIIIGMFILIPLFGMHGKVVAYAGSTLAMFDILKKYSFYRMKHWKLDKYYAMSNLKKSMASLVLGKPSTVGIVNDHLNGNSLDNRPENIRQATYSQNAQRRAKMISENTTSTYLGVSKRDNKTKTASFSVRITHKRQYYDVGKYADEQYAAKVYDVFAIHFFGIHATTNGLLNENEINEIIENGVPTEYRYIKHQKKTDLPPCIQLSDHGTFNLCKKDHLNNGKTFCGTYKTLEEAKEKLQIIINNNLLYLENQERERLATPIKRNKEGLALIESKTIATNPKAFGLVADGDYYDASKIKWSSYSGKYLQNNKIGLTMHQYIWIKHNGPIPAGLQVDHEVPTRPYDNRISKLRLATVSMQQANKPKNSNCFNKYIGYTFLDGKFRVDLRAYIEKLYEDFEPKFIEKAFPKSFPFETEEEAAELVNIRCQYLFGFSVNRIDFSVQTTYKNRLDEDQITPENILAYKTTTKLEAVVRQKELWKTDNIYGEIVTLDSLKGVSKNPTKSMENKIRVIKILFPDYVFN